MHRRSLAMLLVVLALAGVARADDPPDETRGRRLALRILDKLRGRDATPPRPSGLAPILDPVHGAEGARLGRPEYDRAFSKNGPGVTEHLLQAISMNAERAGWYAAHSGGARWKSLFVSRYLALSESTSLLALRAAGIDRRARELNAAGVPVLVDDVIPLQPLPVDTPPHYRGVATDAQRATLKARMKTYLDDVETRLERGDLLGVATSTRAAIADVVAWEQAWGCHLAMTRHVLGTVGIGALRGEVHALRTPAANTRDLSVDYLRALVRFCLDFGQFVDKRAQPLHARGLGIVVNEFTDEAFLRDWSAYEQGGLDAVAARSRI